MCRILPIPYHVYIHTKPPHRNYWWINLGEDALRARIADPWDEGDALSWGGQSAAASDVESLVIYETAELISEDLGGGDRMEFMRRGQNVTNDWILGAPGRSARNQRETSTDAASRKDPRRVMVVHGRNISARNAMFSFIRSLGLAPIEWEEAVAETGAGSPYNLEAVQAAMEVAQAVVVVLTAEDRAGLLPQLADDPQSPETALEGQPRQNVMLEAGMAMGTGRATTILVEIGRVRGASDFHGLNVVRLTNDGQRRSALRNRLISAGCDVNQSTQDWLSAETAGDFDAATIMWEPDREDG